MISSDPIARFQEWFQEAQACTNIADATAMCLATASRHGAPSARVVLLKDVSQDGFTFYTNLESRKSKDIKENQQVALCFYWDALARQVRIEGYAEPVSDHEANAYFDSRPRESQLGAWASYQSREIEEKGALEQHLKDITAKYGHSSSVPRPNFWGGWRVVPTRVEFWTARPHRLHKRELYVRTANGWEPSLLYP